MKLSLWLTLLTFVLALPLAGGEPVSFADASFLLDEAFASEEQTIEHALSFGGDAWTYAMTHEFVPKSQRYLVSYSLPVDLAISQLSLGEVAIDYRQQFTFSKVSIAPRLSMALPTNRTAERSMRADAAITLPLSIEHSARFATHWNLSAATGPLTSSGSNSIALIAAGGGAAFVIGSRLVSVVEVIGERDRSGARRLTASPGVRYTIDVSQRLQIVPGIAVPTSWENGSRTTNVIFHVALIAPVRR